MCLLSVIVPVYNVEGYLNRCIDSLVLQRNFEDIELFLIDDGSSDSSGNICDCYSEKYDNIIVVHKENGGLSDARNAGIEIAKGKYIAFLDSDDFVSNTFIEDILFYIKNHNSDMILYHYAFEREPEVYSLKGNKSFVEKSRNEILDDLLKTQIGNQVCFCIYLAELFNDIRFPVGRSYEDIATLYKLILKSNSFICINYTYYIYNITNLSSITKTTSLRNMLDMYKSLNEQCDALYKYFNDQGVTNLYLEYYRLDKLIYIYLKVSREIERNSSTIEFINELDREISKIGKISFSALKYYNIKKYFYYRFTHFFK